MRRLAILFGALAACDPKPPARALCAGGPIDVQAGATGGNGTLPVTVR